MPMRKEPYGGSPPIHNAKVAMHGQYYNANLRKCIVHNPYTSMHIYAYSAYTSQYLRAYACIHLQCLQYLPVHLYILYVSMPTCCVYLNPVQCIPVFTYAYTMNTCVYLYMPTSYLYLHMLICNAYYILIYNNIANILYYNFICIQCLLVYCL